MQTPRPSGRSAIPKDAGSSTPPSPASTRPVVGLHGNALVLAAR